MAQTCPHCGAVLPEVVDAHCPVCRGELPATPPPQNNDTVQSATTNQPPSEPEAIPAVTTGEIDLPDEQAARFWRTLFEITPTASVTRVLVPINVVVFVLMGMSGVDLNKPSVPDLIRWGADFGPKTLDGEWWRILTCMFVHIGIIHIALNMWVLIATGPLVERMLGNVGFLLMYLISGLGGSLASLCWHPDLVSAGASGAIFGVYGALLGLLQRQRESIPTSALTGLKSSGIGFLAYNLIFGLMQPDIDMAAHLGGLATGFLCGLLLSRPFTPEGVRARPARNIVTGVMGFTAVVIVAMFISASPPASVELDRELERCEQIEQRAFETYNSALEKVRRGEITDSALADIVERDILPEWRAARNRLTVLKDTTSEHKNHVATVLDYMRLREEGWKLYVEAVRERDGAKAEESIKRHNLADETYKQLGTH